MLKQVFIWLSKKLYPNGIAFRIPGPLVTYDTYTTEDGSGTYTTESGDPYVPEGVISTQITGGISHRVHEAMAIVQTRAWQDALSILDSMVADNPNFTIDDCHVWYERLGIYDSGTVARLDMMAGINQKFNYPGGKIYGRSYFGFIQDCLQLAGFNVFVYENRFDDGMGGFITKTPEEILGTIPGGFEYDDEEYGDLIYGSTFSSKIVDYLEPELDAVFAIGGNYRSTYFIAGSTITTFAEVPVSREIEFRQLVLTLQPKQMCAFTFINYV